MWASGPLVTSAKTCSTTAWPRCCPSAWTVSNGESVKTAWWRQTGNSSSIPWAALLFWSQTRRTISRAVTALPFFDANAAWLSIAAMAHNLLRAAGSLASLTYAKARAATIRRDLIAVAARTARHGRGSLTLHLPQGWHREREWLNLWDAACGPPAQAA